VAGDVASGAAYFAVAPDGTLAVVRGAGSRANRLLALVDRKGGATQVPLTPRGFRHPRFSPDGKRLAFTVGSGTGVGSDADVWVYSLESGSLSRLTFAGNIYPAWSPTGDRIAYLRGKDQAVVAKPADGSGTEEQLKGGAVETLLPGSWSRDGRTLAVTDVGSAQEVLLLTTGEAPRLFEKDASAPAFSPDGRWIAYQSPASGGANVFVRSATGDGKWQVSSEISAQPRWSGDGRELFYLTNANPRALMAVTVESGAGFRAGPPRVIVADLSRYMTATAPEVDWDVAPRGDRFVFIEVERAKDEGTRLDIALHWVLHLATGRSGGQDTVR
jgi:serine/threonine-protein kinase